MIAAGDFAAKRNECKGVLKRLDLLSDWIKSPVLPSGMPAIMRSMNYREQWEFCDQNKIFDAKLIDGSLLQFRLFPDKVSYSFLEAPYRFPNFEDFAYERVGEDWVELEEILREEFEVAASSAIIERPATPFRYDYEPALYKEGRHPAGHFHFGYENQIRVASRRLLTPLSFVIFVVRQAHPDKWDAMKSWPDFSVLCRQVREAVPEIEKKYFKGFDLKEIYLT